MSERTAQIPVRTFTTEFAVGAFMIVGVLRLTYLAVNIASMRLFQTGTYQLQGEFDNISGLEVGASVEIAGVPIGEVTKINLNGTTAVISFEVRNEVKLRSDGILAIRTKGIIGDRYVKVVPGGSEELIPNGGVLAQTESVVDIEDIIGKLIHQVTKD